MFLFFWVNLSEWEKYSSTLCLFPYPGLRKTFLLPRQHDTLGSLVCSFEDLFSLQNFLLKRSYCQRNKNSTGHWQYWQWARLLKNKSPSSPRWQHYLCRDKKTIPVHQRFCLLSSNFQWAGIKSTTNTFFMNQKDHPVQQGFKTTMRWQKCVNQGRQQPDPRAWVCCSEPFTFHSVFWKNESFVLTIYNL